MAAGQSFIVYIAFRRLSTAFGKASGMSDQEAEELGSRVGSTVGKIVAGVTLDIPGKVMIQADVLRRRRPK